MEEEDILQAVKVLSSDPIAIKNWQLLYDELKLPAAEVNNLSHRHIIRIITTYQLFKEILETWKSSKGNEATGENLDVVLRRIELTGCADAICEQFWIRASHSIQSFQKDKLNKSINQNPSLLKQGNLKIEHNYQEPVSHYISRPHLEQEIMNALQIKPINNGQLNFPIVVLHGIGGNGKTTLTRTIVKLYADNNYFGGNSVWINAEYEENIISEFLDILNIKKDENVKINIQKLLDSNFFPHHCLLVFDNVNDFKMILSYLPLNKKSKTSVLISSNSVWEAGDLGEVKHISVNKFTYDEFSKFAQSKIKDVTTEEIEILAEYTGRFPYLANIVLSGAAIWKKLHVGIKINQYLDLNDVKPREPDNLIYKRSPQEIVERQMNLIEANYREDGVVAHKMLCVLAYCHSRISEHTFRGIISVHEGFKISFASKWYQNREHAINVGARILVEQGFLQKITEESNSDNSVNKTSFVPSIHRSHKSAIRIILKEKGKERRHIEQILALVLNTDEDTFDADILWRLGIKYGKEILKFMFDSPHFLFNLVECDVSHGVNELVNYAKKTKTKKEYLEWVLFNGKHSETIETPRRMRMLFGFDWTYFQFYFADFGEFFQKIKSVLKDSDIKEIFTPPNITVRKMTNNKNWMNLIFDEYPNLINAKFGNPQTTFLHTAVWIGKREGIEYFIKRGVQINIQDNDGATALHFAASVGKIEIIEILLKAGATINIHNNKEETPLHYAVYSNKMDAAKCLLSQNANPNIPDIIGKTPLKRAAEFGYLDIIQTLLNYNADPNIQSNYGDAALHWATDRNNLEAVKILISNNANPNIQDISGNTPLMRAAEFGYLDIIQTLLDYSADLNVQNEHGDTALHWAADKNNLEAVKILISNNANPNIQDISGNTPLIFATLYEHLDSMQALLDCGADPNIQNNEVQTALHLAAGRNYFEAVKLLILKKADPNLKGEYGYTPLILAICEKNQDIVEILLQNGADPNFSNKYGHTPIIFAILFEHLEILQVLLDCGAGPNIQNNKGETALHSATGCNNIEAVKLLVSKKADPNIKDQNGDTAVSMCKMNSDTLKILLSNNANPNNQDNDGDTLLHWAVEKNEVEFVQLLLSHGANPRIKNNKGLTPKNVAKKSKATEVIQLLKTKSSKKSCQIL